MVPEKSALERILQAVEARRSTNSNGPWLTTLLLFALTLTGIAIYAWVSWRKGHRLAELEHQQTIEKERKGRLELDSKNEVSLELSKKAETQIQAYQENLKKIDTQIQALKTEKVKNDAIIDKITSWRDIDPGTKS